MSSALSQGPYVYTKLVDADCLDHAALTRRFTVFRIGAADDAKRRYGKTVDALDAVVSSLAGSSASFGYEDGALLLVERPSTASDVLDVLASCDESGELSLREVGLRTLPTHMVLRLLVNRYRARGNSEYHATNLTGRLLAFEPAWMEPRRGQVHALELGVDRSCSLTADVRTFTNWSRRDEIYFRKGKSWESYTRLSMGPGDDGLRRRRVGDPDEITYIQRQVHKDRYEKLTWMSYDDEASLRLSKAGQIDLLLDWFGKEYVGQATMALTAIAGDGYTHQGVASDPCDYPALPRVHVVDTIGSPLSKEVTRLACRSLEDKGVEPVTAEGRGVPKGVPSLVIVREKEDYHKGGPADPYEASLDRQHLALGDDPKSGLRNKLCKKDGTLRADAQKGLSPVIELCLRDLQIKADLAMGRFARIDNPTSLFGPPDLAGWSFSKIYSDESRGHAGVCLSVSDDGISFSLREFDPTDVLDGIAGAHLEAKIEGDLLASRVSSPVPYGIIKTPVGVSGLYDTGWHAMPDMTAVRQELRHPLTPSGRISSGKENVRLRFNGMVNYNWFPLDERSFAYSGGMYDGRDAQLQFGKGPGVPVRYVRALRGSPLGPTDLISLVNTTYVRFRRLSVYPYPFKYLDEWERYMDGRGLLGWKEDR